MFNSYEYFNSIFQEVPGINKIYRASGFASLEEVLKDIRNNPDCCLVVRDSGDGFLNLKVNRLNNAYHTVYIMVYAKVNDDDARINAKRLAMSRGIALFDRAKLDSVDFGDPTYGLQFERIDYNEIGPVAQNYYGYSFGFTIDNYMNGNS